MLPCRFAGVVADTDAVVLIDEIDEPTLSQIRNRVIHGGRSFCRKKKKQNLKIIIRRWLLRGRAISYMEAKVRLDEQKVPRFVR